MTAPYDRDRPLVIDGVAVVPWCMSSLGTWTATAIDRRNGVASWLVVKRSIVCRQGEPALMMWEWEARTVHGNSGGKSRGGDIVFEATPEAIDEALGDAMAAAESAVFARYDISASFDGWRHPEVASA